jgi:hypothetical protein
MYNFTGKISEKKVAEMARIGRKGRLWLRAFHVFFMGLFMGVVITELVIIASTGSAQSDSGLQDMYKIVDTIGSVLGPTGGSGIIITGVLLAWLTPWGFFKHKWVVYKIAGTVLYLLISFALALPLVGKLAALAEAGGLSALQNPEYISLWNWVIILDTVNTLLLISMVFISEIKPWHKREGAEEAA